MMSIFEQIRRGDVTVKWERWQFGGGRDWHNFTLYENGEECGYLSLGTDEYRLNGITFDYADEAYDILLNAVKRDDAEILINNDLPCGYEDITRGDLLGS